MKKQALLRWFWSILEYLMVFPIILIISGFSFNKNVQLIFTLSLPFHMLVSIIITMALKKFSNLVIAIITVLYVAGVTMLWGVIAPFGTIGEVCTVMFATGFFFIWGIRAGIGASGRNLFFYSIGLIVYGISVPIINKAPDLEHLTGIAIVFAVIYVIIGLPISNRRFLLFETREKSSLKIIPGTVIRGNRLITTVLAVIILLFSLWRAFLDAFVFVAKGISFVIGKIIGFFSSLYRMDETGQQGPGPGNMYLPPAESDSIVSVILNILSILFVLFLLFLLIRYIVRNHKRIIKALHDIITGILGSFKRWSLTEQGYFDRHESILKTEIAKKPSIFKRIFKREPKWRDMKDNASRVRFIYAKFVTDNIRKGFNYRRTDTPAETIKRIAARNKQDDNVHKKLKNAYNGARYSNAMPCDETVNELKNAYLK